MLQGTHRATHRATLPSMPSAVRLLCVAACLALLLAAFLLAGGEVMAEDPDFGGDVATAATLTLGVPIDGEIGEAADRDFFKLDLSGNTDALDVWFTTTASLDTYGFLLNADGNVITYNDDSIFSTGNLDFTMARSLSPGVYYAVVGSADGSTGAYTLSATAGTDVGGRITEITSDTAVTLGTPKDAIARPGDQDLYRIDLSGRSAPADIVIYTTTELYANPVVGGYIYIDTLGALFDDVGGRIEQVDDSDLSDGLFDFFIGDTLEPRIYYIAIVSIDGAGPYRLHVNELTDITTSTLTLDSSGNASAVSILGHWGDDDKFTFTHSGTEDVFVYTLGPTDTQGSLGSSNSNDDGGMSPGHSNFFLADNVSGSQTVTVSGFDRETGPYRIVVETADDQGNTTATGQDLAVDSEIFGVIDSDSDEDWFELVLSRATEVFLYTTGNTDTVGTLLDSSGNALSPAVTDDDSGVGLNFLIRQNLEPGTYYLQVEGFGTTDGPYALFARSVETLEVDADTANFNFIDPHHDSHFYKIDLSGKTDKTDVWINSVGLVDSYGTLYDSDLNEITTNDDSLLLLRARSFHLRESLDPGIYYLNVSSYGTGTGSYRIRAETVPSPGSIALGDTKPGTISSSSDTDRFRLNLGEKSNVILFVKGITAENPTLTVSRNSDLNEYTYLGDEFLVRDNFSGSPTVTVSASGPGTYTIQALEDANYTNFITDCTEDTNALMPSVGDDLHACQWHLDNRRQGFEAEDINVVDVWADKTLADGTTVRDGIKGQGVNVVVVDDGMDIYHPDLRPNVEFSLNHDYGTDGIHQASEHHGTGVAGLIAARDNSLGVRGVAPQAKIFSHNLLANQSDFAEADSMVRNRVVTAVSNNSWGEQDGPGLGFAATLWEEAVVKGIGEGFHGKGVFYAFAAGNGALEGDDANLEEVANFYAVTGVCAVNDAGRRSDYSEAGASLWVCAPSSNSRPGHRGVVTTENSDRYRYTFGGTSAAAPQVAGVATLMRQANPELTWRDIKLILAATARQNHATSTGWETGVNKYGSTAETYNWNREYGFGVVDAKAAVDAAKTWVTLAPLEIAEVMSSATLKRSIPDGSETGTSPTLTLSTDLEFIEFVEVRAKFSHPSFRDLEIELTSPNPSTTKTMLLSHYESEEAIPLNSTIRFGASQFLGENPSGTWTLTIRDKISGESGSLDSWTLKVYGHKPTPQAPTIDTVTQGEESLTVAWRAPSATRGSAITAYDLRYKDENGDEEIEQNKGTENPDGTWQYEITGLTGGIEYDVQVRARNDSGPSEWSESTTGTPETSTGGISVSGPSSRDYAENGTDAVATYTAQGENAAKATWSLSGDDAEDFNISSGGSLTFKTSPDFEAPADADTNNTYIVTVKASYGSDEMDTQDVTVTVTDVSELGMLEGMESISYAENGTDAVGTYTTTGPDTATWSLDGGDGGDFSISSAGVLTFRSSPNYETPMDANGDNVYEVMVKAEVGGEMEMVEVTVMVTNAEEDGTVTLEPMHPSVGTAITATLADPDIVEEDTVSWQWASADAMNGPFTNISGETASYTPVEGDTGKYLQATASYTDAEGSGKNAEKVTASAVTQLAVNGQSTISYAENGTDVVGTYTASGSSAASINWSLSGDDAEDFNISSGGSLTFKTSPDYETQADANTDNVYNVTVVADAGTNSAELDVTITVTDVSDERPATVQRYDTNGIEGIQISELYDAFDDYFAGEISLSEFFDVFDAYFG